MGGRRNRARAIPTLATIQNRAFGPVRQHAAMRLPRTSPTSTGGASRGPRGDESAAPRAPLPSGHRSRTGAVGRGADLPADRRGRTGVGPHSRGRGRSIRLPPLENGSRRRPTSARGRAWVPSKQRRGQWSPRRGDDTDRPAHPAPSASASAVAGRRVAFHRIPAATPTSTSAPMKQPAAGAHIDQSRATASITVNTVRAAVAPQATRRNDTSHRSATTACGPPGRPAVESQSHACDGNDFVDGHVGAMPLTGPPGARRRIHEAGAAGNRPVRGR